MRGRLTIVRHGQTEWSLSGQHTGRTDLALTEEGERLAALLRPRLTAPGVRYVLVLSSPLRRARRTGELAGFGDRLELTDGLLEWDYGAYEGRTTADIRTEHPGWELWTGPVPGGETLEQVADRVDHVVALAREIDGDTIAFAHGHVLRVLAARWLGLAPSSGRHLALSTASVSVLGWERTTPVLSLWNDTSHLHPSPGGAAPEPASRPGAPTAPDGRGR